MKQIKFAIATVATILSTAPALACSCMFPESAQQQMESASVTFIGAVIDTGPREVKRPWWHWLTPWNERVQPEWDAEHVTTFQVDRMLKGPSTLDTITFVHRTDGAMCGMSFSPQQSGVFIGFERSDGLYSTSLCASAAFSPEEFIAAANRKN